MSPYPTNPNAAARKPVVHIVDDDVSVRTALSRLMDVADMEPHTYSSAEEFLSNVGCVRNACLVLDVTMPDITGPQVQEILNARGIPIPVITVSASDDNEARQRSLDLGAKLFFRKPVDDQALIDAIMWVIEQSEHPRSGLATDHIAESSSAPPSPPAKR